MDIPSFEFDPVKNKLNYEKHGISLEDAQELWYIPHTITPTQHEREERFIILGRLTHHVFMAVYAQRGARVRLITCHRADKKWRKVFEEEVDEKKEN